MSMWLKEATELQRIERDRLTFPEWGQRLSLEEYLEREQRLRGANWAVRHMRSWLWLNESQEVLASCETFQMSSEASGVSGHAFGVASVYTEPSFRCQGHASRMLVAVRDALKLRSPSAQAMILFSEVGAAIYERLGFVAMPSHDRVFGSETSFLAASGASVQRLSRAEAAYAIASRRVAAKAQDYAVLPSAEQIEWHYEREKAYAEIMGRGRPMHGGAVAGSSVLAWVVDYKCDELKVLYFSAREVARANALLLDARDVARSMGLKQVRVWESEDFRDWDTLALPSRREARNDALAMMMPLAPGIEARHWHFISRSMWI